MGVGHLQSNIGKILRNCESILVGNQDFVPAVARCFHCGKVPLGLFHLKIEDKQTRVKIFSCLANETQV